MYIFSGFLAANALTLQLVEQYFVPRLEENSILQWAHVRLDLGRGGFLLYVFFGYLTLNALTLQLVEQYLVPSLPENSIPHRWHKIIVDIGDILQYTGASCQPGEITC